jgi:hypothetical protein
MRHLSSVALVLALIASIGLLSAGCNNSARTDSPVREQPASQPPKPPEPPKSRRPAQTRSAPTKPSRPESVTAPNVANACQLGQSFEPVKVIAASGAPVFIRPQVLQVPLTTLAADIQVPVIDWSGEWLLIRFEDLRWGPRVGYIHCTNVGPTDSVRTGG